ncbi:hypothetical protein D3C76_1088730 [compost metagenome]
MDQTVVQRHAIDKGFQHRSRRSDRAHHIDVAKPAVVIDVHRSYPATHFHVGVINDDHRQRAARGQTRFPVHRQLFELSLKRGIQRGHDFIVAAFAQHHAGEQRRQLRHLSWSQPDRLLTRLFHLLLTPDPLRHHTLKHFIACRFSAVWPTVRAQTTRCLWKHCQQRGFGIA